MAHGHIMAQKVPPSCPTWGTLVTVKHITPHTPPVILNTHQRGAYCRPHTGYLNPLPRRPKN